MIAAGTMARAQNIPPAVMQAHHGEMNITGRKFEYDYKTDKFVVTGDAVVTQADTTLTADRIELMRRTQQASAYGHVHLVDPAGILNATQAEINWDTETAEADNGRLVATNQTYILQGAKLFKDPGENYRVQNGFFTTCGCSAGRPDWSISGANMNVHMGGEGTATNGHFDILGCPVIPLPYVLFPTGSDRQSGFLSPRMGESALRGFQLLQPYFWDIDKSQDATVALDVETQQRIGVLSEYRLQNGPDDFLWIDGSYADESIRSESNRVSDIIDTQVADPHIPVDRYDIIALTREHITPDLVAYGDTVSVSDPFYLREMNTWTLSRGFGNSWNTMRNAVSHFGLIDSFDDGYAKLDGTWNQDLIQPQQFALQTLPELLVSGRHQFMGGLFYSDYDAQMIDYWRAEGVTGARLDLYPRTTVPWRLGQYLYGYGSVGLRETVYDSSGNDIAVTPVGTNGLIYNNALSLGPLDPGGLRTRELIEANAGVKTLVERVYNIDWHSIEKLKHTVEPFLLYNYVPNVNQSQLPLYDQVDRIEGRSLLTMGFTSRLFAKFAPELPSSNEEGTVNPIDSASPSMLATDQPTQIGQKGGGVGGQLLEVQVLEAYDTSHAVVLGGSRWSDLDVTGMILPSYYAQLGGDIGLSPTERNISYSTVFLTFEPPWTNNTTNIYMGKALVGSFLQLAYNYIGPGPNAGIGTPGINAALFEFMTLRAYYDVFDRLGLFFAPSWDIIHNELLSTQYGVRLKSPCNCWAMDLGITKSINPSETQYQFQLTLGGIGSVGQNPFGRNPFQRSTGVLPNSYAGY